MFSIVTLTIKKNLNVFQIQLMDFSDWIKMAMSSWQRRVIKSFTNQHHLFLMMITRRMVVYISPSIFIIFNFINNNNSIIIFFRFVTRIQNNSTHQRLVRSSLDVTNWVYELHPMPRMDMNSFEADPPWISNRLYQINTQ